MRGRTPARPFFLSVNRKLLRSNDLALTSSSTAAEAKAQLFNNLVWEGSPTKAADALEAIRYLLIAEPDAFSKGDRSYKRADLLQMLPELESYVRLNQTQSARCTFTRGAAKYL